MKLQKMLFIVLSVILLVSSAAIVAAGDFDWMKDFNIRAEADQSGFRARLAARFTVGNAQINAVLGSVERPADAYMILRLGELSAKATDYVIGKYKAGKGKGWGALAKSLGIKPGSQEFHALKRGTDFKEFHAQKRSSNFYDYTDKRNGKNKRKGKGKGRD